jgi:Na+/H+-dicarboxylate symporter
LGDIFLRLLKMLVVPLVIVSLSAGVASIGDPRKLGKMGLVTLGYFFATTAIAVTIGLTLATLLRPGDAMPAAERARLIGPEEMSINTDDLPGFADRLREMVPENPLAALAEGDMLQVIFFAVMLGVALCLLTKEKADPMVRLLEAATDAMVRMVHMVMVTAPFGVSAMMATVTAKSGVAVMLSLAAYGGVVLLGLSLHVALTYVPSVRFLAGVELRRFFIAARPTQLLTFGTSSSSASLPVTMECAQKGLGISKHVSTFVIPVGSTVNMDGTALYQGVATVFIAQLFGVDLSGGQLLQVVAMATLASVGAAGVPGAGMVTLTMVLTSLGLGAEGVAIIMGLDRILDMFRSAVNVTGDLACTAVVARFQGERPGSDPFQEVDLPEDPAARPVAEASGDEPDVKDSD